MLDKIQQCYILIAQKEKTKILRRFKMGRAPKNKLTEEEKNRIKNVYKSPKKFTPTHNRLWNESPYEVLYRAASVAKEGRIPINFHRKLPGDVTIGQILENAGFITS